MASVWSSQSDVLYIARRFQRREQFDVAKIPPGRLADGDVYPVLKHRAIVGLPVGTCSWIDCGGAIPLGLKFLLTISLRSGLVARLSQRIKLQILRTVL